jgi:hypothetical protein
MDEVPYTNNKAHPVTVGLKTILPGETRLVDSSFIAPVSAKPIKQAQTETQEDPLLSILSLSVANATPKLKDLSTADLESLIKAEKAGKDRDSMLSELEAAMRSRFADDDGSDTREQNGGTGQQ